MTKNAGNPCRNADKQIVKEVPSSKDRQLKNNDHITLIYTNAHSQQLLLRELIENCQTLNV